jgi:hypothetical protein
MIQKATSLLNQGLDINARQPFRPRYRISGPVIPHDSITPLYDAASRDNYPAVTFLISHGADPLIRNLTFTGAGMVCLPPPDGARKTLCGLDAMRTSRDARIVEMAEEGWGVETEGEWMRRRDVFDGLRGYYPYRWDRKTGTRTLLKPVCKRVGSVLKGKQEVQVRQTRYDLRSNAKRTREG